MAEDAVVTAEVPDEGGGESCPTATRSHAATLHDDVAKLLKEKTCGTVRQRVMDALVEEKLADRTKQVLDALGKRKTWQQEIAQLERKGVQNFGLDGKPVGPMIFTKQQLEEIKKAKEKADKLEKALEKSLAGDYSKLAECMK